MRTFLALAFGFALTLGLVAGENGNEQPKHADEHVIVRPTDLKWGPAPAALPPGAQLAVVLGDPNKAGAPYIFHAKFADGYTVPPHWHSSDENVTVLMGTLMIGKGEKINTKHTESLPAGSYMRMPKGMRHFAHAKGETILQVQGVGPFDMNYVNAADDPRNKDKEP